MYLSRNLNWTPTYLIELVDEEKARLTLRAEVINNTEDIENTNVNFVVGVPNFKDANQYSSLVDLALNELSSRGLIQPQAFSNRAAVQTYDYAYTLPNFSIHIINVPLFLAAFFIIDTLDNTAYLSARQPPCASKTNSRGYWCPVFTNS